MDDDERLPPRNFRISLPALTVAEAETLLSFVQELHELLWEAYGDDVFDLRDDGSDAEPGDPDPDDDPSF